MISEQLISINNEIERNSSINSRDCDTVRLIAVSKKQSVQSIREAYQAGQREFGENFLQEALEKQQQLNKLEITWHYIGAIQSNKTKKIAENFDWVHTVDSLKIAKRLSQQRPTNSAPLNICLQINIDNEISKSGFLPNEDLTAIAQHIQTLPNIRLRGLMCIPQATNNQDIQHNSFKKTQLLLNEINKANLELDTLSMGMSGDMKVAIAEGSTMIRIGTAIFGERHNG